MQLPIHLHKIIYTPFQLEEYQNIANAHFETLKQISIFFRYYLLIISAPSVLLIWYLDNYRNLSPNALENTKFGLGLFFLIVGFLGVLLFLFIINLKADSILYARTVNGVRNYFYRKEKLTIYEEEKIRCLPTSTKFPRYNEKRNFASILLAFSAINSTYFAIGLYFLSFIHKEFHSILIGLPYFIKFIYFLIFSIFITTIHFILYLIYSYYRENTYLRPKKFKIGIDIDGVLNQHRQHFCNIFGSLKNRTLNPEEIKIIPVRKNTNLNVTEDDELEVFHQKEYWESMLPHEGGFDILQELARSRVNRIYLITSRNWPNYSKIDSSRIKSENKKIIKEAWGKDNQRTKRVILDLTKVWLKKHKIKYHRLIIEKLDTKIGLLNRLRNFFEPKNRIFTRVDRYQFARKENLNIFIEDDYEHALKLAIICDRVFLINQPYNEGKELPFNVVRINSINELKEHLN